MKKVLQIDNLRVSFFSHFGQVQAVRGVSFDVFEGEALGIVGESGCGKSVTAHAIMGLIPSPPGKIVGGSIKLLDREITNLPEKEMQKIRGKEVGMIFQDPMTSLNPTMKVGKQIVESLVNHQNMKRKEAKARAIELLGLVNMPNPERRAEQYPHEFSGGMHQRVMIALALACNPKLLIADEPTTALDVTVQAQILDLMKKLKDEIKTSIILITHDLGVVAGICSRVAVMYAGTIIEIGTADEIFYNPEHPYTWGLLKSVPRLDEGEHQKLSSIEGQPPDLFSPPLGCAFAARCEFAMKICKTQMPEVTSSSDTHQTACWLLHPQAPKTLRPGKEAQAHV